MLRYATSSSLGLAWPAVASPPPWRGGWDVLVELDYATSQGLRRVPVTRGAAQPANAGRTERRGHPKTSALACGCHHHAWWTHNRDGAAGANAWGLSRYALDAGLAVAVERCGGDVWQGATVTRAARDGAAYLLQVRRSGAAGRMHEHGVRRGRSSWRAAGTAVPPCPRNSAQGADKCGWRNCVGLKVHFENVHMDPCVELYLFSGGYVGINPVESGRLMSAC